MHEKFWSPQHDHVCFSHNKHIRFQRFKADYSPLFSFESSALVGLLIGFRLSWWETNVLSTFLTVETLGDLIGKLSISFSERRDRSPIVWILRAFTSCPRPRDLQKYQYVTGSMSQYYHLNGKCDKLPYMHVCYKLHFDSFLVHWTVHQNSLRGTKI